MSDLESEAGSKIQNIESVTTHSIAYVAYKDLARVGNSPVCVNLGAVLHAVQV